MCHVSHRLVQQHPKRSHRRRVRRPGPYNDRDRYFQSDWKSVGVALDNGEVAEVSLSEKFWTTGPELKSSAIGRWMLDRGVIPRAKGKPPQVDLEPIGDQRFRLVRG